MVAFVIHIVFAIIFLFTPTNVKSQTVFNKCTTPKVVALTFDDGVSKNFEEVLSILDKEHIKATFFIVGGTLTTKNLPMLNKVKSNGHLIYNHTWTHPVLTKLNKDKVVQEIKETENAIYPFKLNNSLLVRPPYGALNDTTKQILKDLGYKIILWNIDIKDWDTSVSKDVLIERYKKIVSNSNPKLNSFILLLHDRKIKTVEILPEIINYTKLLGYSFVTLDTCIDAKN
jgi:peptidoglycan/xylan/chitin deacetylase (PgdA/CDA1 family)